MRFAQLKVAAALFAAVALAVGLSAALAAGPAKAPPPGSPRPAALVLTPAADDKKKDADKEAEAKELKLLQGKWRPVKQEVNGNESPPEEIARILLTIEGDVLDLQSGKPPRKLKIKLAPGKSPREMDLTVIEEPGKDEKRQCVYKLDGDSLTLCVPEKDGDSRPEELKTGQGVALLTLERVKDEKEELAALAGEWRFVKMTASDQDAPEAALADMKWVIDKAGVTTTAAGKPGKADLAIDTAAAPPTIDVTVTEGAEKGTVYRGVYFRRDDTLLITFRDPRTRKDDRPAELKPGDGVIFVVMERRPKR